MSEARGHIALSGSVEWSTPPEFVEAVREALGGTIDLDPCAAPGFSIGCGRDVRLPEDGLKAEWTGSAYVNPPFGRVHLSPDRARCLTDKEFKEQIPEAERGAWSSSTIADWITKAARSNEEHGAEVILLCPVTVDTRHWQDVIFPTADAIWFPRGRIRFVGAAQGAPMACAFVYWGPWLHRFAKAFARLPGFRLSLDAEWVGVPASSPASALSVEAVVGPGVAGMRNGWVAGEGKG